jgi:hypothetical protein
MHPTPERATRAYAEHRGGFVAAVFAAYAGNVCGGLLRARHHAGREFYGKQRGV